MHSNSRALSLLGALLILAACGKVGDSGTPRRSLTPQNQGERPEQEPTPSPSGSGIRPENLEVNLGAFRNTWYYLALEGDFKPEPATEAVLDMNGATLIQLGKTFFKALKLEGSAKLSDGRLLNFAGRINGDSRFKWVKAPFGLGIKNCELTPLRSIAVDPRRIPYGTVVRIEETVGLKFADGTIHDGVWIAEDTGSAIVDDRIDLFMGAGKTNGIGLEKSGIDHFRPLTVIQISPPDPNHCSQK